MNFAAALYHVSMVSRSRLSSPRQRSMRVSGTVLNCASSGNGVVNVGTMGLGGDSDMAREARVSLSDGMEGGTRGDGGGGDGDGDDDGETVGATIVGGGGGETSAIATVVVVTTAATSGTRATAG